MLVLLVVFLRHLRDDGSYSSIDRSARIPDVAIPEYIPQNTPEKVKEYIDLVEEEIDVDDSHLELQRNKYLAELSDQERILADFFFYLEYKDVSIMSIDENNPAVIQQNEELRHNLECSVLLDIVNPNYINWLIDKRKKKEYIDSIVAEKAIDLEKAKDNPCYDTMKAEWLKDKQKMTYREYAFFADKCRQSMSEWEKMFPNNSNHFTALVFNIQKSMIEDIDNRSDNKSFAIYGERPYDKVYELCHVLQSFLQGNRIKRRSFDGLHHWNRRTIPFTWRSNQNDFDCIKAMEWYDAEEEKDKEKHLENLRVKRVEKVFVEDEKIRKERERHEKEVDDFLNNDFYDSPKLKKLFLFNYNQVSKLE
ncbi:DNA ligase [Bienertia sinuspersici]